MWLTSHKSCIIDLQQSKYIHYYNANIHVNNHFSVKSIDRCWSSLDLQTFGLMFFLASFNHFNRSTWQVYSSSHLFVWNIFQVAPKALRKTFWDHVLPAPACPQRNWEKLPLPRTPHGQIAWDPIWLEVSPTSAANTTSVKWQAVSYGFVMTGIQDCLSWTTSRI